MSGAVILTGREHIFMYLHIFSSSQKRMQNYFSLRIKPEGTRVRIVFHA